MEPHWSASGADVPPPPCSDHAENRPPIRDKNNSLHVPHRMGELHERTILPYRGIRQGSSIPVYFGPRRHTHRTGRNSPVGIGTERSLRPVYIFINEGIIPCGYRFHFPIFLAFAHACLIHFPRPFTFHIESIDQRTTLDRSGVLEPTAHAHLHREMQFHDIAVSPFPVYDMDFSGNRIPGDIGNSLVRILPLRYNLNFRRIGP